MQPGSGLVAKHPCRKDGSTGGRKWDSEGSEANPDEAREGEAEEAVMAIWRSKRSNPRGNFLGAGSFPFLCNFLGALSVRLKLFGEVG